MFWGYSPNMKRSYCLRVDLIKNFEKITPKEKIKISHKYITYEDENSKIIKYKYDTKFDVLQKMLLMNTKAKIIAPINIKDEFIFKLRKMKADCEQRLEVFA